MNLGFEQKEMEEAENRKQVAFFAIWCPGIRSEVVSVKLCALCVSVFRPHSTQRRRGDRGPQR